MFNALLGRRNPTTVDEGTKLRPSRDVFMAERDGIAVLLDLRREVYLGLDEVGTMAWREIENGASADSVALRVCEVYDAPVDAVRVDIQLFVSDLRRRRLVERA